MDLKLLWRFLAIYCCSLQYNLTNGIRCYSCDSEVNVECATKPGNLTNVEECTTTDDECVTYTDDGLTKRGCLFRLFPGKFCNSAICERCKVSLCNNELYPADRLKCYQCKSCKDVSESSENLLPCPIYKKGDRCYTNINQLKNAQRGCVATNLPENCSNICLKCNYDGCNNEMTTYKDSCISCTHTSAHPNVDCLRSQNVMSTIDNARCALDTSASGFEFCSNDVVYGSKEQCFTHINAATGAVVRGCATKMNLYEDGETSICYGDNCNNQCADIGCNMCNSADNNITQLEADNCRQGVNLRWKRCNANVNDCYSCETGSEVRRGCANDALAQPTEDDEACYNCRGVDGCNMQSVRSCYQCTSLDGVNCDSMSDHTIIKRQHCTAFNELCVSTVYNKLNVTYVLRGCASMIPECTANDIFCARCNASLCNFAPIVLKIDVVKNSTGTLKFSMANAFYIITIFLLFLHYENLMCFGLLVICCR